MRFKFLTFRRTKISRALDILISSLFQLNDQRTDDVGFMGHGYGYVSGYVR
jgi:hypothetical protein